MGLPSITVLLDNASERYSPGEIVSGRVVVDLKAAKRVNCITVRFKGKAKTEWTRKTGRTTSYFTGKEIYFDQVLLVAQGNNGPIELGAGKHTYEFSFSLPGEIPCSFSGKKGNVKYSVKVKLERPWKFNQSARKDFSVLLPLDLNEVGFVKEPVTLTIQREFCWCFKIGNIVAKIKIPCSGFVSGQTVPLIIDIDNISNIRVDGMAVYLKKYVTFYSNNRNNNIIKSENLLTQNVHLKVDQRQSQSFFHNIAIPNIEAYNLTRCGIITVEYKLKFHLILSGFHANMSGKLPVMIGHIPLTYITPIEHLSASAGEC